LRLELTESDREFSLFNMTIDSKSRGCDIVRMKVVDVMASVPIKERASELQSKTQMLVRFEISEKARTSVLKWMGDQLIVEPEYPWPEWFYKRMNISMRQYAGIVRGWITSILLEERAYDTHTMRWTKVTQIYKETGKLCVVPFARHTKRDSTARNFGVELENILAIAKAIEM
jgi:hypothetical protein